MSEHAACDRVIANLAAQVAALEERLYGDGPRNHVPMIPEEWGHGIVTVEWARKSLGLSALREADQ